MFYKITRLTIFRQTLQKNLIFLFLLLYAVIAALTIIFFDGTGDAGDSVNHYLFAKYAPSHPELYFNHWAKPIYVLLFSPFAQFGIVGVKVLNAIISLVTIFFTFRIAQLLKLKNAIIVAGVMIFSPLYYILTFSGLTEPLFALFFAVSIYCCIKEKYLIACIIVSFLPFIRSEGLIVIGVFGLYFLFKSKWKFIPFLLTGHLIYSLAGYFVYYDFLWVFKKIPYANLGSPYGYGKLMHFVEQLINVVGVPIYILFWLGFIILIWQTIKKKIIIEEIILIFFGFLSFFIAHSLFWYLGIFNSMGLNRVFIGVIPLISLIALHGFNFLTENIWKGKRIPKLIISGLLISYIIIFPFTSNPSAIKWEKDMMLSNDQKLAIKTANFIRNNLGNNHRIICSNPYLIDVLQIDCFDPAKRIDLNKINLEKINTGDIIIWENWFAKFESKIKKADLDNNTNLQNIFYAREVDKGREIIYAIYIKKDSLANKIF